MASRWAGHCHFPFRFFGAGYPRIQPPLVCLLQVPPELYPVCWSPGPLAALGCHWLLNDSSGDPGLPFMAETCVHSGGAHSSTAPLPQPHVLRLHWWHDFSELSCHTERDFAVWSSAAHGKFMEDKPEHLCSRALVQKEGLALSWVGFESSPGPA